MQSLVLQFVLAESEKTKFKIFSPKYKFLKRPLSSKTFDYKTLPKIAGANVIKLFTPISNQK
jgi:hypothetical protein